MNFHLILLVSLALVSIASSMVIMKPRPRDKSDDLFKKSVTVEEDARVLENSEEADDAEPEEDLTNEKVVRQTGFLVGGRGLQDNPNELEKNLTNKKVMRQTGFLVGGRGLQDNPNKLEKKMKKDKLSEQDDDLLEDDDNVNIKYHKDSDQQNFVYEDDKEMKKGKLREKDDGLLEDDDNEFQMKKGKLSEKDDGLLEDDDNEFQME